MRFIWFSKESVYIFLFGVAIILFTLNGCGIGAMPSIDVSFWAGDSKSASVLREQESKKISCADVAFDDYACLTYKDIKKIYAAILQCKEWGPPIATQTQMLSFEKKNHEVIRNVLRK